MKIVRKGCFETNSSSTHAIVVPKKCKKESINLYLSLDHNYGFGREESRLCNHWDEKLAYTYMVLKQFEVDSSLHQDDWCKHVVTQEDIKSFITRVNKLWKRNLKKRNFDGATPNDVIKYIDEDKNDGNLTGNDSFLIITERYGNYVDHAYMFDDTNFIDKVLSDDAFLERLLFSSDAYITIGGDEYRGYNIKTIGFEYDYEDHDYVNEKGEKPPKKWFTKNGRIKKKYFDRYYEEYNIDAGGFWDKLKEYEKDNDVFLKGN